MRRAPLPCCALASLVLASCSSAGTAGAPDDPVGTAESAIAYGSPDGSHTAVVALLAATSNGFDECSGTVVQVKNGVGYVLTAAHCCNMTAPSLVVMSNDYSVGVQYFNPMAPPPQPPVFAVTPNSVYYDSKYDGQEYDFCMLKFSAPAGTPVIPVATSPDGLSLGASVEHVGFGMTESNMNNTGRRTGTAPVDQNLTNLILQSSQGSGRSGVCEGDSGGPALFPAGMPQAQQHVVGTTSYGNSSTCAQASINVCMRVTSEMDPNSGFIATYLNDNPVGGVQAGSTQATCDTCQTSAESGACASQTQACAGDQACLTLSMCLANCNGSQSCESSCAQTAGQAAVNEYNAFVNCVCQSSVCGTQCMCMPSSASCGLMSGNASCDACINASCCSQAEACSADMNCPQCVNTGCTTDPAAVALVQCLDSHCASPCGAGSSSTSTSSSSSTSTSSSSGNPVGSSSSGSSSNGGPGGTSSGGGQGGGGGTGSASNGSGGGDVGAKSGCSMAAPGSSDDPARDVSLACLIVGAALGFSRRRRPD